MRGGAGRTRTSNQTVMGGRLSPTSSTGGYFDSFRSLGNDIRLTPPFWRLVSGRNIPFPGNREPPLRRLGSNADQVRGDYPQFSRQRPTFRQIGILGSTCCLYGR